MAARPRTAALVTVTLPAFAAQFIAGGGRDVDSARLSDASALAAGTHVQLLAPDGAELGLAIADPDNAKLRVIATAADGFAAIDGALIGVRVERALALRKQLGLAGDGVAAGGAYRLVHGAGDGLPGFACDVLGDIAVIWAYGDGLRALGVQLAEAVVGFARLAGAVVKLRARAAGAGEVPQDIVGTVGERASAREHGADYEIHPLAGTNVGLFTDMRQVREPHGALARFAAGARCLNLFSYTGALGLACARAGAATVTNVDTSGGVHAWARGNFARAGLGVDDDARWRFETGDAVRFLQRAARDRERYELVVIDPPSHSTARGQPWALGRDYPELIGLAADVIPAGGVLWLASNTHDLGSLAKLAHKGLRERGRGAAIVDQAGLPPEYPTLLAQPADRYLQIVALRLA